MSNLKNLADRMKADARKNAGEAYERQLRGGVALRILATDTDYSLLIIRERVMPSDVEIRVFRSVFEIPNHCETKRGNGTRNGQSIFYALHTWSIFADEYGPQMISECEMKK